jgi:hypothetical protein
VSSPPNDESPQVIFSLARQRLLKFGPDDAKRLFRQYRRNPDLPRCPVLRRYSVTSGRSTAATLTAWLKHHGILRGGFRVQ